MGPSRYDRESKRVVSRRNLTEKLEGGIDPAGPEKSDHYAVKNLQLGARFGHRQLQMGETRIATHLMPDATIWESVWS